jgi:hypothetical protein
LKRKSRISIPRELAVAAAHHLDQVVVGDHVAGLTIEDVVEPGLRSLLAAQPLVVLEWIGDPPASVGVDVDEPLVPSRHLIGVTIPFQEAVVKVSGLLNEGELELQSRCDDRFASRLPELEDHHLLGLADDVERSADDRQAEQHHDADNDDQCVLHGFTPGVSGSSGRIPLRLSSSTIFCCTFGYTACIVSR